MHPTQTNSSPPDAPPLRLVFWETTSACNLECAHCRRLDVSAEMTRDDLTGEEARALVDSIAQFAKPILVLSGGEPLLREDILELSARATSHGLRVALATNGTLVDDARARAIREAGIQRTSISIDGATAATHDAFRRQAGSFENALAGARHLQAAGVSVQFNCTISNHNVAEKDDIYRLAVDFGADALHLFLLVPVGCGAEIPEEDQIRGSEYEDVLVWISEKADEGAIQLKATCAPHYFRIIHQQGKKPAGPSKGMHAMTKGCLAGSGVLFVSHKGQVFPCGYFPVECGNVREQSLEEIWRNSEVFHKLRDPDRLTGKCGACGFRRVCGGCRARAYALTGDYLAEEPCCVYVPKGA